MSKRKNPYAGQDPATRAAKARGYPARSVFKLEEIDQRVRLFKGGMHVLDLGAAPGSWSLYASQKVGPSGRVLGVDLQKIEQRFGPNTEVVQGDAFDLTAEHLARFAPYDVVVSDMAPRTSGVKSLDQAASFELYARALDVGAAFGKLGSSFVGKLFMGSDFDEAVRLTKEYYGKSKVIRPQGTRQVSKEIFIVGAALKESAKRSVLEAAGLSAAPTPGGGAPADAATNGDPASPAGQASQASQATPGGAAAPAPLQSGEPDRE